MRMPTCVGEICHRGTNTGRMNASDNASKASKNVALPTTSLGKRCQRENGTARLDQAVDGIDTRADGGSEVRLTNRGTMVMPAELKLTFADGTTDDVRLPVDMWKLGRSFTYRVPGTRAARAAELDPRGVYPDIDRSNNLR